MVKILILIFLFFPNFVFADVPVKEIFNEEVWEDKVTINGIVAVRKTGRLIIKEGTEIKFVYLDEDGDGIGDGEIYVEGEILSLGSSINPVIFTTLDINVKPAMWKYVMVNHAKYAYFENTIFEGAFSGLQVHFSKAVIKNNIFRKNVDGFRFSTAQVYVCGNVMTKNRHGIRYEERDSKGKIEYNIIEKNDIGIFPVTACKDAVLFQFNIIKENGYNIKVGEEQKNKLSFKNNYFGTIFENEIKKTIYDSSYDKNLSTIKFKPFLKEKIDRSDFKCSENY